MQYQSFPGVKGGSQSLNKLSALRLPELKDKVFLDVGCNEGFFCGYADLQGASKVIGLDKSKDAIQKAKQRFAHLDFRNQSWDALPEDKFDVIIMLSALHYADDQELIIHNLMNCLAAGGVLVLEISIALGNQDDWIKVKRSIDERYFPTRVKLNSVLKDYAWKVIGHSVDQAGDPLKRYVLHIRKLKPYAYLLAQNPGTGKTTIGRRLFANSQAKLISGDYLYALIADGRLNASAALQKIIAENYSTTTIDRVTKKVGADGLLEDLVDLWVNQSGYQDFAIDSYLPGEFIPEVKALLANKGFFPIEMQWNNVPDYPSSVDTNKRVSQYERYLKNQSSDFNFKKIIEVNKLPLEGDAKNLKWHIDSPVNGEWFSGVGSISFAGWLIGTGSMATEYEVFVEYMGGIRQLAPSKHRHDVIDAYREGLSQENIDFWSKNNNGFNVKLEADSLEKGLEFGVIIKGQKISLAQIKLVNVKGKSSLNKLTTQVTHFYKKARS